MRALWLLLLSLACGIVYYQFSNPVSLYADAADIPDHQQWFSLQWQGHKVGYLKENWSRQKNHLQWSQLLEIKGTARGQKFNRLSKEILHFDLDFPYQLMGGSWFVKTDQQQESFTFKVQQHQIHLQQASQMNVLPYPENWTAQQLWAPQRAAADLNNTSPVMPLRFSGWDMKKLQVTHAELSFGEANLAGEVQGISQRSDSNLNTLWQFNRNGKLLSRSMGASLVLQQSSQSNALQLSSADVFLSSLLELDKPLGTATDIAQLELEIGEYLPQISAQKIITTTQQAAGSFLQIGFPGDYENRQPQTFLKQQANANSERLNRIANSLIKQKQSTLEKVEAVMNFVAEFIEDEDVLSELSVNDVLDSGKGDCSEHALLFAALSRAAGIPAREANGLLYLGDNKQKYSAHVWAEVAINGHWISIDPTWKKIGLDPGYIRVYGDQASTKTTLLAISGKTLRVKKLSYL